MIWQILDDLSYPDTLAVTIRCTPNWSNDHNRKIFGNLLVLQEYVFACSGNVEKRRFYNFSYFVNHFDKFHVLTFRISVACYNGMNSLCVDISVRLERNFSVPLCRYAFRHVYFSRALEITEQTSVEA